MTSVSRAYFSYIYNVVKDLGYTHPQASETLALDAEGANTRLKFEDFSDLLTSAGRALKDPYIGLHVAENFRISTYGEHSKVLAFCETIEAAAKMTERYSCLVHTMGTPVIELGDGAPDQNPRFRWAPSYNADQNEQYRQVAEYIIGNYVLSLGWLSWGFKGGVKKVTFMHAPHMPIAEYEKILGCESEFNAPHYSIILDHGIIDKPLPTADAVKLSLLQTKLESSLRAYNLTDNLVLRVEQKIREYIQDQKPTLPLIASSLGLGQRTLKRNLKDQNTSFGDILSDVKKDLCDKWINEGQSFGEIADLLGYSDASAFTRAYKKWHGTTPSKRKDNQDKNTDA